MLILVSPAKTLDFESHAVTQLQTTPAFIGDAQRLVALLRLLDVAALRSLMSVSEKIASVNYDRFAHWKKATTTSVGKQAVYAFKGDVYTGLAAHTLDEAQQQRAQQSLRILSGLYGVLKPMDIIMPYRLEMGTKLHNDRGQTLYAYWQDQVSAALEADIQSSGSQAVLNLASNEYFKVVQQQSLSVDVVSPQFLDYKNGQYKIISFFAKKARGTMARYCIDESLTELDQLKYFNRDGYYYDENRSTPQKPVFLRDAQ